MFGKCLALLGHELFESCEVRHHVLAFRTPGRLAAMNERNYDRYRRYGIQFYPDVFRMNLHNGVNIGMPIKSRRAGSPGRGFGYDPKITVWADGTEAPDERRAATG